MGGEWTYNDNTIHDSLSAKEHCRHIDYLELLAVFKVFWAFEQQLKGLVFQVATHNTVSIYRSNKQGGIQGMEHIIMDAIP